MQTTAFLREILKKNLYSIEPVMDQMNKQLLGLAYTPGVGAMCMDIVNDVKMVDQLTLRGRSVAVVSDGSMFGVKGHAFMPVMDWFVYQIKHHSGLDAFPFVVSEKTNLEDLFRDLSTTYSCILYLDSFSNFQVPDNVVFIRQEVAAKVGKTSLTDASHTSVALSHLISKKSYGEPSQAQYEQALSAKVQKHEIEVKPFMFQFDDVKDNARQFHRQYEGKIRIVNNLELSFNQLDKIFSQENLRALVKEGVTYSKSNELSCIVTDGTAILGFGDIGPTAGLPVMEGKSLLFRYLGGVEVVPYCMFPRVTPQEQIEATLNATLNYVAVNLEDIKAPQCFDIETGLKDRKVLPIFHDDQHGTAIVVLSALINALKVVEKDSKHCRVVVNGAGAAGITIVRLLMSYGFDDVTVCDSQGAIYKGRQAGMNAAKNELAQITNRKQIKGNLEQAIQGADVFIGVSAPGALKGPWIKTMHEKPIVFALANPVPQILPDEAYSHGAYVYGSGRSDFPNQINNSLVFPGVFKGLKQNRHLKEVTDQMKLDASISLSNSVPQPTKEHLLPPSLDENVPQIIASAMSK